MPDESHSSQPLSQSEAEFIRQLLRGEIEPIYPPRLEELGLTDEGPIDPGSLIESLCGADNSQEVEQYDGTLGVTVSFVAQHERPVGQLQWNDNLASIYTRPGDVSGARWGSGTLIANDLYLTAGHCFDQNPDGWTVPRANGTMNPISSAEIATNMHVNFNYQRDPAGNIRTATSYAVTALVEYRLGGVDFAIVRLAGNPGATWGTTRVAQNDAAVNDMLCIIQHPAGLPKRIEAGPLSDFVGNAVRYNDIDTLGGSSGAGILGPQGQIVGVHTNGGCTGAMTGHNFGQRISAVRAASPTIQNLPDPVKKLIDDPTNVKKVVDDPVPSKKVLDDPTNIKKIVDDPVPSKKVLDDPTNIKKLVDDPRPSKKVFDDPTPFKKIRDDVPKRKILDDGIGGQKGLGDVKGGPDVPGQPGVGGQPFILATPHHAGGTEAGAGQADLQQALAQYQAQLQQIEAAISQYIQELARLEQTRQALLAELQALLGSA